MFGSAILETAIGIIFVFLLVSVICTAIREWIEGFLKTRAAFLEHGVRELLHDRGAVGLARSFYNHPLIYSLFADRYEPRPTTKRPRPLARGHNLPTYIPTRNFALALMDIAARGPANAVGASDGSSPVLTLAAVRANVLNLENAPVQRVLLTAIDTAQGDLDKAVANLAAWYDSGMDRVSGAYKRATQKVLFGIGLVVAIGLNVNPLSIADYLYRDAPARAVIVARAEAAARDSSWIKGDTAGGWHRYAAARAELDSLRLPIGWAGAHFLWMSADSATTTDGRGARHVEAVARSPWKDFASPLLGWLITALAATLGAPFWFDLLNKMMVVRSTVKPHEKSGEESSEDRQSSASKTAAAKNEVGSGTPAVGATGDAAPPAPGTPASSGAPRAIPPGQSSAPPPDPEAHIDGCDVELDLARHPALATSDEDLPAAKGGVA